MRCVHLFSSKLKGFTLIELLVVVAIIALLISILLPSLSSAKKQAQTVACMSNLDQVMKAIRMYQDEHFGWLPQSYNPDNDYQPGSLWSEAAWGVSKKDLWFYKLAPKYLGNPRALVCPGDPFYSMFDFEAQPENGMPRTDLSKPSCGYGMNYCLRHFAVHTDLLNADAKRPRRPANTILLAEVGPDDEVELGPLYGKGAGDVGLAFAWRDGGRLIWDDGARGWYDGPTWLTARHLGSINMSSFDGAVHRVKTVQQLIDGPRPRNPECMGLDFTARTYICYLCYRNTPDFVHYQFHKQGLWWWTGNPEEIR